MGVQLCIGKFLKKFEPLGCMSLMLGLGSGGMVEPLEFAPPLDGMAIHL